jgi:broad specificity phosphatase PhoE
VAERGVELTIARHGATEWSKSGQHTGMTDLPLLPEGEEEAAALGQRLGELRPAIVLTSPLSRAKRTCELAGFGAEAIEEPRLLEMNYGEYEGLTTATIRQERPGWDLFRDGCPGGETIEQVGARVDQLLGRLLGDSELAGEDVLLFAHGHVLRVLTARWLTLPPADARRFTLPAGRFGRLGWEHEWTVVSGWGL